MELHRSLRAVATLVFVDREILGGFVCMHFCTAIGVTLNLQGNLNTLDHKRIETLLDDIVTGKRTSVAN